MHYFNIWSHCITVSPSYLVTCHYILIHIYDLRISSGSLFVFKGSRSGFKSSFLLLLTDILVGLWVTGIFVEEVKQASRQGKERYISQWWHIITLVIVIFFFIAGVLWISGYAMLLEKEDSLSLSVGFLLKQTNVAPRTLLLLSNSFYAVSLVLTFFQVSHYFQVRNRTLHFKHGDWWFTRPISDNAYHFFVSVMITLS